VEGKSTKKPLRLSQYMPTTFTTSAQLLAKLSSTKTQRNICTEKIKHITQAITAAIAPRRVAAHQQKA